MTGSEATLNASSGPNENKCALGGGGWRRWRACRIQECWGFGHQRSNPATPAPKWPLVRAMKHRLSAAPHGHSGQRALYLCVSRRRAGPLPAELFVFVNNIRAELGVNTLTNSPVMSSLLFGLRTPIQRFPFFHK